MSVPLQCDGGVSRKAIVWFCVAGSAATFILVTLAICIDSEITRIAVPGIVTGVGTVVLASLNMLLLQREQSSERRTREANTLREARKVVTFAVRDRTQVNNDVTGYETLQVLNAGREPILDVALISAIAGPRPEELDLTWLPGSGGGFRQVLLPGASAVLNGTWSRGNKAGADLSQADRGNAVISVAWTDAAGVHWKRDGRSLPVRLAKRWSPGADPT